MKQVTIKNNFISLTVLDYGAIIQEILVRDKTDKVNNVVVGFENPREYLEDTIFLGACVGRFAGRISGSFRLNGKRYELYHNNGIHLHGGKEGFGKKYWNIETVDYGKNPSITLSYVSPAMEEGYPGELRVTVFYQLIGNALHITHSATTDHTTVINLTNHSYFQLDNEPQIDHYLLQLKSSGILETRDNLLPTGSIIPVENTVYDFFKEKRIATVSLDTPYVLESNNGIAGSVYSPISGISMQVRTNQPAIVVYRPKEFAAVCFETQNYPDAPNYSHFPSSVLHPGETYCNKANFKFDLVF